jgi:hypothetical protein
VDSTLRALGVSLAIGNELMFRQAPHRTAGACGWAWVPRGGSLADSGCGVSLFCVHAIHAPGVPPLGQAPAPQSASNKVTCALPTLFMDGCKMNTLHSR